MSKEKKKEKKNTRNADKKLAKINTKNFVEKKFGKKKENSQYMMFKDLVVKNLDI